MDKAAPALPTGWRLDARESVGSTNDEARALATAGAPHGSVVWALRQEAGRGRRGRGWASPPGNLYASSLLRADIPASRAGEATFLAAVALAEALLDCAPTLDLGLKWPNDVLVGGRKIAGILLESGFTSDGRVDWIVLGTGVNLAHHPEDAERPATSLAALGHDAVTVPTLLAGLTAALDRWHRRWLAHGFAPLRAAWMARALGLGQPIAVRLERETLDGRFADLDADGALLLDLPDGRRRRIAAGDVFLSAAAGPHQEPGRGDHAAGG